MKKYDIVEIEWIDAIAYSTKAFIKDLVQEEFPITISCGFLINEDKNKIILASMMYEEILEQYQIITRGMIKKITKLKEIKK